MLPGYRQNEVMLVDTKVVGYTYTFKPVCNWKFSIKFAPNSYFSSSLSRAVCLWGFYPAAVYTIPTVYYRTKCFEATTIKTGVERGGGEIWGRIFQAKVSSLRYIKSLGGFDLQIPPNLINVIILSGSKRILASAYIIASNLELSNEGRGKPLTGHASISDGSVICPFWPTFYATVGSWSGSRQGYTKGHQLSLTNVFAGM